MRATENQAYADSSPWLGNSTAHYENFPVGSWLLPASLRPAVASIYRFARYADDVADEGQAAPAERLAELGALREALNAGSGVRHPVVDALLPYLSAHSLSAQHFRDLLSAFSQDVVVSRYPSSAQVLDYCNRSANPVGRVMLELFGRADGPNLVCSDAICTALQLINFAQDVALDWPKDRVYLPLDWLAQAGLTDRDVGEAVRLRQAPAALRGVVRQMCELARQRLDAGRPLLRRVPLRLSLELRVVIAGGTRILDRLARGGYDPIAHRPVLGVRDAPAVVGLALFSPSVSR